jgi:hypothetical protein
LQLSFPRTRESRFVLGELAWIPAFGRDHFLRDDQTDAATVALALTVRFIEEAGNEPLKLPGHSLTSFESEGR